MANTDRLILTCSDGVVLTGDLYKPEQDAKGALIFLSGAAIKKEFYTRFCSFLSEHGYYVLSFDNRGIGENKGGSLRGCDYNLLEWAQQDTHAAIEYCKQQFPSMPVMLVGHSMGAQLVGFTANNNHLKAVIGIATSTGTWWKMKRSHMFASMLLWYVIHPVLTPIFGYAPLRSLGIMEDLPKRVIKQWSTWCKSEFYFADHIGKTIPMDSFYPLKVPLIVHYFKDDPIATDKTVTDFTAIYRGTRTRMIKHRAKDYHQKKVGHFRMFHSDFEKSFWRTIVHEIDRFMQHDHC